MLDRSVVVYTGNNFEVEERKSVAEFQDGWRKGAIVERKMPCPTRRHPDRTKNVYVWIGEDSAELHSLSAQMPPFVTEMAAAGNRMHKAFAFSYRGIMMGNASRPIVVPA